MRLFKDIGQCAAVMIIGLTVFLGGSVAIDQVAAQAFLPGKPVTDDNPYPVKIGQAPAASVTHANVASATGSTLLLAANASRVGGAIVNDSAAILYLKLGTGASSTSYDYVIDAKTTVPGSFDIPADYRGAIYGAWATADGAARVSERVK